MNDNQKDTLTKALTELRHNTDLALEFVAAHDGSTKADELLTKTVAHILALSIMIRQAYVLSRAASEVLRTIGPRAKPLSSSRRP